MKKAKRRGKHRKKRPRRPQPGMMLFQDGSPHRWIPALEQDLDLIATMDDATSEVTSAFLVDEEGTLKAFGLKVGKVGAGRFEMRVLELLEGEARLGAMVRPMLKARAALITQFGKLHRLVLKEVRGDAVCRRFMTTHSVGPITALTTGVDDPERFRKSKNVGAHFGITPRKYSSGETDYSGHISKCGDAIVRSALYEAATVLLTRDKRPSALKAWGERIAQRSSPKRARVAVARKLAVILHRMGLDGSDFRREAAAKAAG